MLFVTMTQSPSASNGHPTLANFDAVPAHARDLAELRESVTTLRALVASPVPIFGRWRRFLASTLRLPVRPSAAELEVRELVSATLRSYDAHIRLLDPSSHTH